MTRPAPLRAARVLAIVAVVLAGIAVLPVTLVAALAVAAAWHRGWTASRLYLAAAWCAPMLITWVVGTAVSVRGPGALLVIPLTAWHAVLRHRVLTAAVLIAPVAVPAGLLGGGWAWSLRITSMTAGAGGRSPAAAAAFDQRQWRHQARTARARLAAPGAAPLLTARGDFVAGAVIRASGHPSAPLAILPAARLLAHQVVIGSTGTGKSTLLLRLWAGFMASGLGRHAAGLSGPPLIVVLDCKGGADARRIADRSRRVLREAGAQNVAVWPDECRLSLWLLPPPQLISTLVDLIEHGTGGAAYYTDVMEAIVMLAVQAPCGPPASTAEFLARLDASWLTLAYSAGGHDDELALARAATRQVPDVALRFRTLFRRLGAGLDGPGSFADADAWYCILEGTADVAVAEAQARALADLLASYVTRASPRGRPVLLAVDEFSAVSRRLPIWELFERARALGLAVQVSAQSWHGLAPREDDRFRIAATAEGGIWLLRTPYPEPIVSLAGQRAAVASTRQLAGRVRWPRSGSSALRPVPVADPELIRHFDVGQAAYLYRGGVTFAQVKRLVAGPAAISAQPSARSAAAPPATVPAVLADVTSLLDAAFGAEPGTARAAQSAPMAAADDRTARAQGNGSGQGHRSQQSKPSPQSEGIGPE